MTLYILTVYCASGDIVQVATPEVVAVRQWLDRLDHEGADWRLTQRSSGTNIDVDVTEQWRQEAVEYVTVVHPKWGTLGILPDEGRPACWTDSARGVVLEKNDALQLIRRHWAENVGVSVRAVR